MCTSVFSDVETRRRTKERATGQTSWSSWPKPAFERVVAEHGAIVLRVCRAVLGPDDAEDAWAETFVAALRAYPELPAEANVRAWLVTIAHRKAVDGVRARSRRPFPVDPQAHEPEGSGGEGGGGDPQAAARVWDAVRRLPEKQRQAIAYHYLAGLPFKEVAGVLGGSTEAARRAAADGLRTLRRRLADSPNAEDTRGVMP